MPARKLRAWQLASVVLGVVESATCIAALALVFFAEPPAAYVGAAAAVLAASLRHGVEWLAVRRFAIDARPAYALVPLDERARRRTARTLILLAILPVLIGVGAVLDREFVPAAVVSAAAALLLSLDLARVHRHGSYLAVTRLIEPTDVKRAG